MKPIKVTSKNIRVAETEELKKSIASDLLAQDKSLKEILKEEDEETPENSTRPT